MTSRLEWPEELSDPAEAAIATTVSGDISLALGMLVTVPPDLAWHGLQELHELALGRDGAGRLDPMAAWRQYGEGVTSYLGQLAALDPTAANDLLGSMNEYLDFAGSLAGLEGPYLSTYGASLLLGETPELWHATGLLNELGVPPLAGGGAESSLLLDAGRHLVTTAEPERLGSAFGDRHLDLDRARSEFLDLFDRPGGDRERSRPGASDAREVSTAAVIGAGVATLVAGPRAAPLGAGIGAVVEDVAKPVVKGIGDFFEGLFGSSGSDNNRKEKGDGGKAARGEEVTVKRVKVTRRHEEEEVGIKADGTRYRKRSSTRTTTQVTEEKKAPGGTSPDKCEVAPGEGYEVVLGHWHERSKLVPTGLPDGPGLTAMTTHRPGGALRLADLAGLDGDGLVQDSGFLTDVLTPAEELYDRLRLALRAGERFPQRGLLGRDLLRDRGLASLSPARPWNRRTDPLFTDPAGAEAAMIEAALAEAAALEARARLHRLGLRAALGGWRSW